MNRFFYKAPATGSTGGRKNTPMVTLTHSAFSPRLSLRKACALAGLLALLPLATPAHAGGSWSVSYDYSGTTTSSDNFTYAWYRDPYIPASQSVSCEWYHGYYGEGDGFHGNVTATFTWVADPNTPNQPPTPLYVKETGSVAAYSSRNSAADDGLGDAAQIATETGYDGSTYISAWSHGSHLVQKGTQSPVTITRHVSGSAVRARVTLSYKAEVDSRAVTLGTSSATFHKDPNTGLRVPDIPDPDSTLELTSIYSHHASTTGNMGLGGGTATVGEDFINWIDFSPSFVGDWHWQSATDSAGNPILAPDILNPDTWSWSPNESEDTWDFGKWSMPFGNISYQDGQAQGQPTGSQTKSITYNATDNTDGATGTAKASVTLHDEWENAHPDTPATTLNEKRTYAPGYAGVSNNTGVKQTSPPTMTGTINASLTLGFNFSPSFEVSWAKILGIAVNASGNVGASLSISVPGPLLDPGYAAYPFVLTTWQTDNYLVDNYTTAGYAGAVPQSVDDPNSVTNTISWTEPLRIGVQPPP